MVLNSCRDTTSGSISGARPAVQIRQQNILPVGEVQVKNFSSYSLEIELNGSREILMPRSSKFYSGLKSEIDVHFWMVNKKENTDSVCKVAWCNVHPEVVGTEIIVRDPSP